MSKDSSETCGNCAKHEPDKINPAGGLGDCPEPATRLNLDGYIVAVLKYPGQKACKYFEKKCYPATARIVEVSEEEYAKANGNDTEAA